MNEHLNMANFIAPKSDQINADDLIGGPRTITVTRVTGNEGNAEQPVNVFFEGDGNKPFRPCKSMRRVMVKVWGADASKYVGRSMTIYRDPKVKWGGMEVGGIRISHMTGLDKPEVMALTETRSARKPYTVQPLKDVPGRQQARQTPEEWAKVHRNAIDGATSTEDLDAIERGGAKAMAKLAADHPAIHADLDNAMNARRSALAREGRADEEYGDQFAGDDEASDD